MSKKKVFQRPPIDWQAQLDRGDLLRRFLERRRLLAGRNPEHPLLLQVPATDPTKLPSGQQFAFCSEFYPNAMYPDWQEIAVGAALVVCMHEALRRLDAALA